MVIKLLKLINEPIGFNKDIMIDHHKLIFTNEY